MRQNEYLWSEGLISIDASEYFQIQRLISPKFFSNWDIDGTLHNCLDKKYHILTNNHS